MPTFQEFQKFSLQIGTIVSAKLHPTARKPSLQLDIDFGAGGIKKSSAQLTKRYTADGLVGRQVVAVVNFPPRRVGDYVSEVLVLGAVLSDTDVVLLGVDETTPNGTRIA
jgi:tRNA-binding protein